MTVTRTRIVRWWGIVLTLASVACYAPPGKLGPQDAPTRLVVENHGLLDVNVYAAESDGGRGMRLGTANGNSRTVLKVPRSVFRGGELMLRLHAIGSTRSWLSPRISLGDGDEAILEINSYPDGSLGRSFLWVSMGRRVP